MTEFPQVKAFCGDARTIRVVGHRGARGILPENTLEGFEFALTTGVRLLEFDVAITRDGVPVITHNHHLTAAIVRDADGQWLQADEPKVSSVTYADLGQYDVGGLDGHTDYGKRFPDQSFLHDVRIPRLTDLIELVSRPENEDVCLMLEIKSDPDMLSDVQSRQRLVRAVVADVRRAGVEDRTILHSFDWSLLDECRRQAPDMPTSYLSQLPERENEIGEDSCEDVRQDFEGSVETIPDLVHAAGGRIWCPHYLDITASALRRAHELGLCVAVWTVNDHPDIARMAELGVDAIVSDYPGRVQRYLVEHGYRWKNTPRTASVATAERRTNEHR